MAPIRIESEEGDTIRNVRLGMKHVDYDSGNNRVSMYAAPRGFCATTTMEHNGETKKTEVFQAEYDNNANLGSDTLGLTGGRYAVATMTNEEYVKALNELKK